MKKLEHSIRIWIRYNGTLDVTHHREYAKRNRLCDVDRHFQNFKTVKEAIKYMNKLKRNIKKSNGDIVEFGFGMFGFQTIQGKWSNGIQNKIQVGKIFDINNYLKR